MVHEPIEEAIENRHSGPFDDTIQRYTVINGKKKDRVAKYKKELEGTHGKLPQENVEHVGW